MMGVAGFGYVASQLLFFAGRDVDTAGLWWAVVETRGVRTRGNPTMSLEPIDPETALELYLADNENDLAAWFAGVISRTSRTGLV